MKNIHKIKSCYHLWQNNIPPDKIATDLSVHRATVYRWIYKLRTKGYRKMLQQYKNAKKRSREKTPGWIKNLVCEIRDTHSQACAQKVAYFLKKDFSVSLSVPTIYRILRKRGKILRHYKNKKYFGRSEKGEYKGHIVQADTVMLGELVAFTFYDTFSKTPFVRIATSLTSAAGAKILKKAYQRYGEIKVLQRDGGPEFKKDFEAVALLRGTELRTSRPYRKNDQSYIESFNRVLRKECVGWTLYKRERKKDLQRKVDKFLHYYYYDRPHLSLNMLTPHLFSLSHLT